jgi:hypothetical protein
MLPPTTKGSVLRRAILTRKRRQRTTDSKSKYPGTFLTGITEPTPDNRPDLKLIDATFDIYNTGTVGDCIKLLKRILPYWIKHQLVYPHETKIVTLRIRGWLIDLRAACGRKIPPIPSDLLGIKDWMLDAEASLKPDTVEEEALNTSPKKTVKTPSKKAIQAYHLVVSTGKTQKEAAKEMSRELKRKIGQYQVSRWVKQVRKWYEAVSLPIELPQSKPDVIPTDPYVLNMRTRTDGKRTGDPRNRPT